ncbi:sensor domain-containing diguanylate cyclase [Candidatus Contubernalis alkaliaceticus]|uniref:sensor domain-containing diguanylate cyclase n=1 Tax=Candidatus Contubernalis alkaliaceticus TaxID=338645 RepID=UPI001F4BDF95|nr:diguanylate cyclase [Candidatus Contubernalis alkalaceticus]UNC90645.1 GGDEF domain-containing protein [Candidatus Contubernalis alkalaceticus]
MEQVTWTIEDLNDLKELLASEEICTRSAWAKTILVQVYTARNEAVWLQAAAQEIQKALPAAVVVGATTVGEIANGCSLSGGTVVGFSFFRSSQVNFIALSCKSGQEQNVGRCLTSKIEALGVTVKGLLLLATPLSINVHALLQGLAESSPTFPVFGAGAADYASMKTSLVSCGSTSFSRGVVAVVFSGPELHVDPIVSLGWKPLSKEMTITDTDGMLVKTIDGKPAFEVYQYYLGISNDDTFSLSALEFPFLLHRNEDYLARIPISVEEYGAIRFVADINIGEKVRLGYGNPEMIIGESKRIKNYMHSFAPDAIFLYSCGCRRFLLQEEVELETLPFEEIAPTIGFYTYGEFYGTDNNLLLLNAALVVVGLREGPSRHKNRLAESAEASSDPTDPYAYKHIKIITRLLHFIETVTEELEHSNRELALLSVTDKLTQLYNRLKLDQILTREVSRANRYGSKLSIVLCDIDYFKSVNDVHGHQVGDEVLVAFANVLKDNLRDSDILGRWGGEEFLIILPENSIIEAKMLVEKLRWTISNHLFPVVGHMTCSFGITTHHLEDTESSILGRADEALYKAKQSGRNRVGVKPPVTVSEW